MPDPDPPILAHSCQILLVSLVWGTKRRGIWTAKGWDNSLEGEELGLGISRWGNWNPSHLQLKALGAGHWLFQALASCLPAPWGYYQLQSAAWDYNGHTANLGPHHGMHFQRGQWTSQILFWPYLSLCLNPKDTHAHTRAYPMHTVYLSLTISMHFVKVKNANITSSCEWKINMYVDIKIRKMFYKIRR